MHPNSTTAAEPASLYDHQAHLDTLRRQRRAPTTLKVYALYVGGFVRFLIDRGVDCPTLEHLSPDLVGKYQDHTRGHSRGTRDGASAERQAVQTLKIFSRWLWRHSLFPIDPLARVEAPRLTKLHRVPFSKGDCLLLLEAALLGPDPIVERALVLLGLDTGARIGELCSTDVDDLDLDQGAILFRKTSRLCAWGVSPSCRTKKTPSPCVVVARSSQRPSIPLRHGLGVATAVRRPSSTWVRNVVLNQFPLGWSDCWVCLVGTSTFRQTTRSLAIASQAGPSRSTQGSHGWYRLQGSSSC